MRGKEKMQENGLAPDDPTTPHIEIDDFDWDEKLKWNGTTLSPGQPFSPHTPVHKHGQAKGWSMMLDGAFLSVRRR